MTTIKYALLCEDVAHREFLKSALSLLVSDAVNFEEIKTHITAQNKREVDRNFAKACTVAFITYKVELFFVFRDVDSADGVKFSELYKMFKNGLSEQYTHSSIIVLPVQCIEHWLCYLKLYRENPSSTKNHTLETKSRNEAKKEIYGHVKISNEKQKPIIQELMQSADLEKLSHHSHSFRTFHGEFSKVLKPLLQSE